LGRSPWLRDEPIDTLLAVRDAEFGLDELGVAPAALRAVRRRALEREPKKRPPGARALGAQLAHAMRVDGIAEGGLRGVVRGLPHEPCGIHALAAPPS